MHFLTVKRFVIIHRVGWSFVLRVWDECVIPGRDLEKMFVVLNVVQRAGGALIGS